MPAMSFTTYASLGAYTGGFSSVRVPIRKTGKLNSTMSFLQKTTGMVTPKSTGYKSNITVGAWNPGTIRATNGFRTPKIGTVLKRFNEAREYTGMVTPKFSSFKRVGIFGVYAVDRVRMSSGILLKPMIGTNRIPFSTMSKMTGLDSVLVGNANAKIKLWSSTVVTITDPSTTAQETIQFWS